jgi:radical SAM protein with 4Fe4S-binding SPASM domain
MIIPKHIQIETINGACTSNCIMCSRDSWTRKPRVMPFKEFHSILEKFIPYQEKIQFLSLQGWGESLLDKRLPAKVLLAKDLGFKSIGFATNCTELDSKKTRALLDAGLDTIICSIDGFTKETHESIRVGTHFYQVVGNVLNFIHERDIGKQKTKVIIRFIRMKQNQHEWEKFKKWWSRKLNKRYGDAVISFDVVDSDGKIKDFAEKDVLEGVKIPSKCSMLNERMIVLSTGEVVLCCADDEGKFKLGNVFNEDPIKIFNNETFTHYRKMIKAGKIKELELCKTCNIPRSQARKDKV